MPHANPAAIWTLQMRAALQAHFATSHLKPYNVIAQHPLSGDMLLFALHAEQADGPVLFTQATFNHV
eukprot:scaffold15089_cov19-Tisochrysis_lutea.AAC.3